MRVGSLFIILGIIYICGGTHEWSWFESGVLTFKEINFIGVITMLFGCLIMTIETVGDNIVEALKKGG